jgi:ERCC4-related helicase
VKKNWRKQSQASASIPNDFGHIVYLETGTGKTYIAIMLLKLIFAETRQEEEQKELMEN